MSGDFQEDAAAGPKWSTPTNPRESVEKGGMMFKSTPHMKDSGREHYKDVNHFFLIKKLSDDDYEGLSVIGTMIQMVFGIEDGELDGFEHFPYCFNDEDAEEHATLSRTSTYKVKCKDGKDPIPMKWSKFIVKAPLDLLIVMDCFPFKILKASLTFELNAVSTEDGSRDLRPNMLLHTTETRNNVSLVEPKIDKNPKKTCSDWTNNMKNNMKPKKWRHNLWNCPITKAMIAKLDQSKSFDLVSPYPEVRYIYDNKKKNCTTAEISFFIIEGSVEKLLRVTVPLILIATMNSLNVILAAKSQNADVTNTTDTERIGGSDFLANSATFALTAVFLLPDIFASSKKGSSLLSLNNVNILIIFAALGLSSVPFDIFETVLPNKIGHILLWVSFAFPMYNTFCFTRCRDKIYERLYGQKGQFVKDTKFKGWYPDKAGCFFEDFKDVMEMNNENDLYSRKEAEVGERYLSVRYDKETPMGEDRI